MVTWRICCCIAGWLPCYHRVIRGLRGWGGVVVGAAEEVVEVPGVAGEAVVVPRVAGEATVVPAVAGEAMVVPGVAGEAVEVPAAVVVVAVDPTTAAVWHVVEAAVVRIPREVRARELR